VIVAWTWIIDIVVHVLVPDLFGRSDFERFRFTRMFAPITSFEISPTLKSLCIFVMFNGQPAFQVPVTILMRLSLVVVFTWINSKSRARLFDIIGDGDMPAFLVNEALRVRRRALPGVE
jgi:hypothetical protein